MVKKPVRNLSSTKPVPPRLFDVLVDGDDVAIQVKTGKNEYETVPWPDVVSQVEAAKKLNMTNLGRELSRQAP